MIYWGVLYRPVVTLSPLERGQGVCEFSLIDRKITHPLSPLKRGNRYSRRYNHKHETHRQIIIYPYSIIFTTNAVPSSFHPSNMTRRVSLTRELS